MEKNLRIRIISLLLAVMMVFGLVPENMMNVLATESTSNSQALEDNEVNNQTIEAEEEIPESATDETDSGNSDNAAVTDDTTIQIQDSVSAAVNNTGTAAVAETECTVTENVIDVTDRTICTRGSKYATVTEITIVGGNVVSCTEDGTTLHVLLSSDTSSAAEITCNFTCKTSNVTVTTSSNTCTLSGGEGTMNPKVSGQGTGAGVKPSGSLTYTIVFTSEAAGTEPVESVELDSTAATVLESKTIKLKATVKPDDAISKRVVWTSSDESIATVQNGTVTGMKEGTVTITAASEADPAKSASCEVTVAAYKETEIDTGCSKSGNWDTWISKITVKGPEIKEFFWNVESGHQENTQHVLNVRLDEKVSDSATIDLAYTLSYGNSSLKGSCSGPTSLTLSAGRGSVTVTTKGYTSSNSTPRTYVINVTNKPNNAPSVSPDAPAAKDVAVGENFELDLRQIFSDADGEELKYTVTKNGETTDTDVSYSEFMADFGSCEYTFTATDTWNASAAYTVMVNTVTGETYDVNVRVPQNITPGFYITKGFDTDGTDIIGGQLTAVKGTSENGFIAYTLQIPRNISRISFRGTDENGTNWGGMSFATKDEAGNAITDTITLRQMQGVIKTLVNGETPDAAQAIFQVQTAEGYYALTGGTGVDSTYKYLYYRFLLVASGNEATYTYYTMAAGSLANTYGTNQSDVRAVYDESASVDISPLPLVLKSAFTITAPAGADVKVFYQNKNYNVSEIKVHETKTNGDMVDWVFLKSTAANMSYRVSMDGKITKAGYVSGDEVTVTWGDDDLTPAGRAAYDTSTTYGARGDDSLNLNINERNNLVLGTGSTFRLKAYRIWQIINADTKNIMIEPDFNYQVLSGEDVISVIPVTSGNGNAENNWLDITANKTGVAIVEIGYDALDIISGNESSWGNSEAISSFTFNAVDPARTGLVVIQSGSAATDVSFGIECLSKFGGNARNWDAELDTLYFFGEKGQLTLNPTVASGAIDKVEVSNDKGNTWTTLIAENGTYTADIVSGNNLIRVTKADKTEAYQVVRGDRITYTFTDDDGDQVIEAGDTVTVHFSGVHAAVGKMAAVYNASAITTNYMLDGQKMTSGYTQYTYPSEAHVNITIPDDSENGDTLTLTEGHTEFGGFCAPPGNHRSIPSDGLVANTSAENTTGARNLFEDITLIVGTDISTGTEDKDENTAPALADGVKASGNTATVKVGEKYSLNLKEIFTDAENDKLTYTVSINGAAAAAASANYTYVPSKTGEYILVFTAKDSELESPSYTVTITVTETETATPELEFDIAESDIVGYVTISLEDNAVRLESEMDRIDALYQKPLGTIIHPVKVPFTAYDTIAEVTLRLFEAMDIRASYSGTAYSNFYLTSIGNFVVNDVYYKTMGEFSAGSGSGWMITWNTGDEKGDWFINKGASDFVVNDGDIIKWKYTCQYGADIGDDGYLKAAKEVEEKIASIGTVTLDREAAVNDARSAYDALVPAQQAAVENYDVLVAAEKAIALLKATEEDKKAAAEVDVLIAAIGTVTKDSEEAIKKAREAYEKLTDLQKLLADSETLETAENLYNQLINNGELNEIYKASGNYLENLGTPSVNSIGGEWMVIGLARSGREVSDGYYNGVVQYLETVFTKNPGLKTEVKLDASKSTENSRLILALTSLGIDPTDVNGCNLLKGLTDMEYVTYQGVNGAIWALIALDSHGYEIPEAVEGKEQVTREKLIEAILGAQLSDSGWDLTNQAADVDMTAMAIQALAPYYPTNTKVKEAVDKALAKLSSMQQSDGSFASVDGVNTESIAQVIVALTALGINPEEDTRFIKKGMSAVDALCTYAVDGGGFMHTPNSSRDGMATEQGYYALVSYFRLLNQETSLYDMSDVTLAKGEVNSGAASAYDEEAAEKVVKLISAIGTVNLYSNKKIDAARAAYNKLTAVQKALVSNYQTLVQAESTYKQMAKEAVEYVEELIDKIGSWAGVTLDSRSKIHKARRAWNSLPEHLRWEVDNYVHLLGAEQIYEKLQEEALAMLTDGVLILSKSELLELQEKFAAADEDTSYDEALELLRTYYALGEEQQLALAGTEELELLQSIVAEENHEDPATGIKADGLEWNIRLVVEAVEDEKAEEEITEKLADYELLTIWDIYLEDVLTGERYELEETIEIWIPAELVGDCSFYDELEILHYSEEGRMEIFNCEIVDNYVVFDAAEFSYYAVLGFVKAEEESGDILVETVSAETEEATQEAGTDGNWIPWAVLTMAGVALLAVLIVLKKRTEEEAK